MSPAYITEVWFKVQKLTFQLSEKYISYSIFRWLVFHVQMFLFHVVGSSPLHAVSHASKHT